MRAPAPARLAALAPPLLVALLVHCTDLPQLQSNVCGNAVVETGEDCDTYPVGSGTFCRPPGSSPGACRLDCTPKTGHVCPPGWGCGTDSICRQPTGAFRAASGPVEANAWRLQMGDFDGNGRQDVFVRAAIDAAGQSSSRIHYYAPNPDHSIALTSTLVLPAQIASPVLADFNADQRTDLACVIAGGIDVMLGQPDQTVSPVAYPAFTIPNAQATIAVLPEHGTPATADIVFFGFAAGQGALSLTTSGQAQSATFASTGSKGPADLAGPMITAAFVEDPLVEACDQLVVTLTGGDGADVYSPCRFDGSGKIVANDAGPIAHVALPAKLTVAQGARAGDVDGDGHLDLLLGTTLGSTYWAAGDGRGGFGTPTKLVVDASIVGNSTKLPVAVGDLNGDGRADFVAPSGIYVSDAALTPPYVRTVHKTAGLWTEGAIADMNADGLPDVVAASNTELDADFYVGSGGLGLDPFTISTTGQVAQVAVGDFDGDRVNDVALVEVPADTSLPDEVSIAWGQAFARPTAPARVGQFAAVVAAATLPLAYTTLSDLVVVGHPANDPNTTLVSELLGNGDRQPIAPYILAQPGAGSDLAIAIAAAPFLGTSNVDIAAVGYTPGTSASQTQFHYWLAAGSPAAQFAAPVSSPALPEGFLPYVAVGGAQRDEALSAWGHLEQGGKPVFVTAAPQGVATTAAFLPGVASAGPPPTVTVDAAMPFGVAVSPEGQLEFRDVDQDGAEDAVLLTGANVGARTLYVAWNDGKGSFSTSRALQVNAGTDAPEGFAFVSADTSGVPRIAYVTRHALVLATVDTKGRAVASRTNLLVTTSATGVAAGDVDGDGVEDLAVADSGNVTILRDLPVLE